MKRAIVSVIVCLACFLVACAPAASAAPSTPETEKVAISIWTYPVGGWGEASTVSSKLSAFRREYPNIDISAKYIDYTSGDATVEEAIGTSSAPDIILEGPERLVANWGARGLMVDISDMLQSETADNINGSVKEACRDSAGKYYIYPKVNILGD